MLKNFKKLFTIVFLLTLSCLVLTACDGTFPTPGTNPGGSNNGKITLEMLEALEFEDLTVNYNGEKHNIFVNNIYEDDGVKVMYVGNGKTTPGTYDVTAQIRYEKISTIKKATLTIEKGISELEADAEQTINLVSGNIKIDYSVNNSEQKSLVILDKQGNKISLGAISKPGVYNLSIYLEESSYYAESNHLDITVTVVESAFDIEFNSQNIIADGNEHELLLEGTLPDGYSVEYENNKGTNDGTYLALAKILNENNEVVETHRAVLTIDNPENEEFKKYLDEFFVWYLEGDQLSVNIFCENPENFGLEHYEAEWYTYEPFGDEEILHDLQIYKDCLEELQSYKDYELNDKQESIYKTLEKFLNHNINYYSIDDAFYMGINYVDQFGGYVADFGTYIEAYSLRSEVEVQDVVSYLESTKIAFPSYLDYLEVKANEGYPLSDSTINAMKDYLKDVIDQGDDYYLKDILNEKIDGLEFLTSELKESYKAQIASAITNNFQVGVQDLYNGLDNFLGLVSEENEGYLQTYENGREVYLLKLMQNTGLDEINVESYLKEIDNALTDAVSKIISAQSAILKAFGGSTYADIESALNTSPIFEGTPEQMMVYLKEFAKSIVPDLKSDPEITIKNMDAASAKVSNAVAYYMKSALDNTAGEYITLNPVKLKESNANDVLGTLAHEGYPGHLYAYVFSKEAGLSNLATIMTNTGHAEGWATYVQLKLYEYAKERSTDAGFRAVMDYLYANQLSGFLLETRLDAGIHLEGWKAREVGAYMDRIGYNSDSAQEIYDLLIEIPASYVTYGYGKLVFTNLHNEAKSILGYYYDEVEFNAMLLSKGWTDLGILKDTYHDYMTKKCHELGIAYNK